MPAARLWLFLLGAFLATSSRAAAEDLSGADVDVYVFYTKETRKWMGELKRAMSGRLKGSSVRYYNPSLLALVGRRGKDKALRKFSAAKELIFLGEPSLKVLKGSRLGTNVLAVRSTTRAVESVKRVRYLLDEPGDLKTFGTRLQTMTVLRINATADLNDAAAVRQADIVLVDKNAMSLNSAIPRILGHLLK